MVLVIRDDVKHSEDFCWWSRVAELHCANKCEIQEYVFFGDISPRTVVGSDTWKIVNVCWVELSWVGIGSA